MKYQIPLAALVALTLGASALPAQTIYLIDLNDTADTLGGYPVGSGVWNAYVDPTNVTGAVIQDNTGSAAAGITFNKSGLMSNSGNGGNNTFNNPMGGPAWVTIDGILDNRAAAADYFWTTFVLADSFTMNFGGMPTGSELAIDLWFSRSEPDPQGFYEYSLDGGGSWHGFNVLEKDGTTSTGDGWAANTTQSQPFFGLRDGNNAARYMNVSSLPITGTTLDIRVTNSVATWSGIGAVRLTVTPADAAVMITNQPMSQTVTEFRPVTFNVGATGAAPLEFQWYKVGAPDELIDGAMSFNYTIPETSLAQNGDQFYAIVSNATSMAPSNIVTLTVEDDTVAPSPLLAESPNGSSIVVTFSEPLDSAAATAPGSYAVTFDGGSASVTGAVLSPDLLTATLSLGSKITGQFSLSVAGVTDRAGNAAVPALILGQAPVEDSLSFLLDFGGAASSKGPPPNDPFFDWNNVTNAIASNDLGVLNNLITTEGTATSVNLEMIRRFNGTNTNGHLTSGLFPASASGDSMFGNTEIFSDLTDIFPSFKLTGLDQDVSYALTFYAARLGVGDNRETQYTVTAGDGDVVAFLNPTQNDTDRTVIVEGLLPTAAGEITVALAPSQNNVNANHFTYLGVLRVDGVPANTPPFVITYVAFERNTNTVTLRFNGRPGRFYALFGSDDLVTWPEINDSIRGEGVDTEIEFVDEDAVGAAMRYYRLQEIP